MNKKYVYIGLAVLGLILLVFIIKKIRKNKVTAPEKSSGSETKQVTAGGFSCKYGDGFPLVKYACGDNVKLLQQALTGLAVDGKFGDLTESRLISLTGKNTITKDEFDKLVTGKSVNDPLFDTPISLEKIASMIKADDEAYRFYPRTGNEDLWMEVNTLPEAKLGELADYYKKKYGKSLYATVDNMVFAFTTNVDTNIMNKLKTIKKV